MKRRDAARRMGRWMGLLLLCGVLSSCAKSGSLGVGDPAPGFTLASVDGRRVSLSDYAGQVVVINFFAHW